MKVEIGIPYKTPKGTIEFLPKTEYTIQQQALKKHKQVAQKIRIAGLAGLAGLLFTVGAFLIGNIQKNNNKRKETSQTSITQTNNPQQCGKTYQTKPQEKPTTTSKPETKQQETIAPVQFTPLMQKSNTFLTQNKFKLDPKDLAHFCKTLTKLTKFGPLQKATIYDINNNGQFDDGEFILFKNKKNNEYIILNQAPETNSDFTKNFHLTNDSRIGIKLKQNKSQATEHFGYYEIKTRRPYPLIDKSSKTYEGFLNQLAYLESTYNNKAQNRFGYMGWFQMGELALNDIGYSTTKTTPKLTKITKDEFKSNTDLQLKLLNKRFETSAKRIAIYGLDKYIGKTMEITIPIQELSKKDIKRLTEQKTGTFTTIDNEKYFKLDLVITPSGMLAGAHLCGDKSLKNFLQDGTLSKDGNGVYIFERMHSLGGREIPENIKNTMYKK